MATTITDRRIFQPADTSREVHIHRSVRSHGLIGGVGKLLSEEQARGVAHRVRMLAHLSGMSEAHHVHEAGLRDAAARQVLALLETE